MLKNMRLMTKIMSLFAFGLIISFVVLFDLNRRTIEENEIYGIVNEARAIANQSENALNYLSDMRKKYDLFDDKKLFDEFDQKIAKKSFGSIEEKLNAMRHTKGYWSIPIVISWTIAQKNAEAAGYQFKVPKEEARNPKNEPDAFERTMLNEIKASNKEEHWKIDEATNTLRFMRPVKLTRDCLVCHGTINDDSNGDGYDPLGFQMEGWAEGEIHGAFEIIVNLTHMDQKIAESIFETLIAGIVILIVALAVTFFFVRQVIIQPINKTVDRFNSAAADLESTATQQAAAMTEQTSAVTEVSTTAQELVATANQIAENTKNVAASAGNTAENGKSGTQAVKTTQTGMEKTKRQVQLIAQHMLELGNKSQRIGVVLEVINELSEQTNLLSLNASIEAAGAGDAGKRFAVVADEVRKLAERAVESTREIKTLVTDIQQTSNTTIMVTEDGTKAVDEGVSAFDDLFEAIDAIVEHAVSTSSAAREIEMTTRQQTTSVQQVSETLDAVALATKQTEEGINQTLETIKDLVHVSKELQQLINA